jgi:hypothetical protein
VRCTTLAWRHRESPRSRFYGSTPPYFAMLPVRDTVTTSADCGSNRFSHRTGCPAAAVPHRPEDREPIARWRDVISQAIGQFPAACRQRRVLPALARVARATRGHDAAAPPKTAMLRPDRRASTSGRSGRDRLCFLAKAVMALDCGCGALGQKLTSPCVASMISLPCGQYITDGQLPVR